MDIIADNGAVDMIPLATRHSSMHEQLKHFSNLTLITYPPSSVASSIHLLPQPPRLQIPRISTRTGYLRLS